MKLRIENVNNIPLRAPRLRISKPNIALNAVACNLLSVEAGNKIWIGEDEDYPGDWYVFLFEKGMILRPGKKGELHGCCIPLYRSISEKLGFSGSYSFQLGTEPQILNGIRLFPIITAPLV